MGSAAAQIDGNRADIINIYVEPDAREIGIGDALLSQLIDELRRREISYVNAQALPGDRATKNLFERHGLIAQTIIVGKPL
jgi:ribosomal protein S18 acetylase RimI-like enzyme